MFMQFDKDEIEAVFRQYVINDWDIREDDIVEIIAKTADCILSKNGETLNNTPIVMVRVKTDPKSGSPYR